MNVQQCINVRGTVVNAYNGIVTIAVDATAMPIGTMEMLESLFPHNMERINHMLNIECLIAAITEQVIPDKKPGKMPG